MVCTASSHKANSFSTKKVNYKIMKKKKKRKQEEKKERIVTDRQTVEITVKGQPREASQPVSCYVTR